MTLDRITLSAFRNHEETRLDGTSALNLLVGENGAGKTNILEALSLFAPGRGLRRAPMSDIVSKGGLEGFAVSAALYPSDGSDRIILGTGTAPEKPGRRLVQVNGAQATAVGLGEWLAISWLTPAMDRLFADSATARRRYLDRLTVAITPAHARHAARYEAALRSRNRLLCDEQEPDRTWLASLEEQMAEAGAAVAQGRAALVGELSAELSALPPEPFARPALTYRPGGAVTFLGLKAELSRQRDRDRAAGRTLSGPHRDDLEVVMSGKNVPAALCSTGEQKAMLIAITLAHSGLAAAGRPSLLLLDEVAAHLDPIRRSALFERLRAGKAQVWLTGTESAPFEDLESDATIWQVDGGEVERISSAPPVERPSPHQDLPPPSD